jgi:5-methylcytosine-specific restriction endonuclease McrA
MAVKGNIPWNKGKTGTQGPNAGSFKKGSVPWNKNLKGIHLSPESEFKKGMIVHNAKPKITRDCLYCGKSFTTKYSLKKVKLCSYSCSGKYLGKKRMGKNHPNWKGGKGSERHKAMRSIEYKLWRKSIFERDNYKCVECGAKSMADNYVYLHADHIKPWSQYPELRYALDNGRTLCISCHEKTESYPVQFRRRVSI